MAMKSVISSLAPIGMGPMRTPDPFLFCVYHRDNYPAGNEKMEAPKRGNGADFDPNAKYRMYHGDRIPGFPQHPHRGFETLTATLEGFVDHTDSMGAAGRYGLGDLQWMTAGKGVVHGENFPLIDDKGPNTLRLFQIWLNLPSKSKMVEPTYVMHWKEQIPKIRTSDDLGTVTLWAGSLEGKQGLAPPPSSWAADPANDVMVLHLNLAPGGTYTIPPAERKGVNRMAYWVEGDALEADGKSLASQCIMTLDPSLPLKLLNPPMSTSHAEVLLLQGKPVNEPVAQRGPFVMNTQSELQQAFIDYQRTQFGGWPWPEDAVVFPRDKGRFSLLNGKEERPSGAM
ncbi:hypothetical protein CEUSTIGMA_g11177.t1 [Chlamydomonas eustigma]|uniref:Pirin N-terminal domain-containing protein n=1 Tax=Chlamydomonas eustigma TaxID=1157962 RepID=A0A250XLI5_9CHLO|nr:hypothetical protein CEUSTIGMA_g11177.t1 [Chlamydomonas eustigma]|eukprot:GAX83752.1 hypothetical protein CEUSTIGMA_g11177.t1 [Chlamydomonas eustigma]